ncbi:MAG: FtsK/SpoIIIE domain-containing protein, partial [Actinomycetota bacterium]|nr:FtsK/SpoIIIE domain-containing protein [Actinomycetota bacterium]
LWERRPGHGDVLQLRLGTGAVPWHPPLHDTSRRAAGAADALASRVTLHEAPLDVDLGPGRVLGIVGEREAVEALLRSLVVQAATLHGPADLRIAVLTGADRASGWSFAKWLPHTNGAGEAAGLRLLGASETDIATVVAALAAMAPPLDHRGRPAVTVPHRLVVVDADGLTEGRPAPVRALLAGATGFVSGIVVAAEASRLPAMCTTLVTLVGPDGLAEVSEPATNQRIDDVLLGGLTRESAGRAARSLAGIDDPEVREVGASLPDRVGLLPLLGIDATADEVIERWRAPSLRAPIGVTDDGPLLVDLVADGPHALIGGTTGSGKSELLRTLVASLAASAGPEHLTFVLIDYKGGSAFDSCARLPHTVGLVTDLDEHLGQRALRCLEAELRHRERVLRVAGATDLPHYLTMDPTSPMPRLVVVIDEFATLAAELPDFIDALVGIAQRGRSLGVHLLLATQRPAGAVKDNIRANTNLRIALRMQDGADSTDVIDTPDAAAIGRRQAGRGYVRFGPAEVVPFQAAIVSQPTDGQRRGVTVELRAFPFAPERRPNPGASESVIPNPPTDLERLVDAIVAADARLGLAPPRRPWPEPLPARIELLALDPDPVVAAPGAPPFAVYGLADDPSHQRQAPAAWNGTDGNLLLYGVAGSGTTTALVTLARSLARRHAPTDLHLYALDFGAGGLADLAALPHVGAVVAATEPERRRRLLTRLRGELDRRRSLGRRDGDPALVVLLDNWSGFAASLADDAAGLDQRDEMTRLVADGPAFGIWFVITADHAGGVPLALASLVPSKLVFRLADRLDYA